MVREIAGLQLVDTHVVSGAIAIEMNSNGSTRTNSEGVSAWSRIRFAPRVGGGLTHAAADHHSVAGLVRSAWKLDGGSLAYECTVPPGCTATLDLPTVDAASITLDGKVLSETKELTVREGPTGTARIELASGTYHFGSKVR
jgi:alpha-L-rhamnosidase